jgi:hypothetical protein
MNSSQPLETNENWKTGTECPETSYYCCEIHPGTEAWVLEGDDFPKCDQKGMPHRTTWHKLIKSH